MKKKMLAAVFEGKGKLNLKEVPVPEIKKPDEVLLQVETASICGTDMRILEVPPGHPATEGVKTAIVSISNNDADENPYSFTLNGTGIIPFILDYVGNWEGQWTNTTFNSTGAANLVVTADTEQKTVQFVIDVDGFVLGGADPDPDPVTLGGTYSDAGINISSTVDTFGDLTLTIDDEGNISGSAINVPNPNIDRIDFNGVATPETMTINYVVTFAAYTGLDPANGIFTLNKVNGG
ncbi:MAG: hypothetical protein MUP82_02375 [Candidatus Marinimicrobia bacterium]|nr:hypothetical protein [Candidatus Neomarinimicrobiota bacterium]